MLDPTEVAVEKLKADVESLSVDRLCVYVLAVVKVRVDAWILRFGIAKGFKLITSTLSRALGDKNSNALFTLIGSPPKAARVLTVI